MEHNNTAPIEGENMILCEDENFTSTGVQHAKSGKPDGRGKPTNGY
jgi:hypothetical protein